MRSATNERPDLAQAHDAFASQYQTLMNGWAELSKCCLAAADDIYQTGLGYLRDQAEHVHDVVCDPSAALREQTYSSMVSSSFDAADRIAHAYLHSLETMREPMMRVISCQLPMTRDFADAMERSLRAGAQLAERGMQEAERGVAETMQETRRGMQETTRRAAEAATPKRRSA